MHSALIAASFLAMVFAPCIVATCSKFFPLRLKIRIPASKAPRVDPIEAADPQVRAVRPVPRAQGAVAHHSRH